MDTLKQNLNFLDDFHYIDFDDWLKEVEKSLKGKSYEQLKSNTYDGIIKEPIYIRSNIKDDIPSYPPYRRSFSPFSYRLKPWKINLEICGKSPEEFNQNLKDNLSKGITSVKINLTRDYFNNRFTNISDAKNLNLAFQDVDLSGIQLVLSFRNNFKKFLTLINEFTNVNGINPQTIIIDFDPFENFFLTGTSESEIFEFYDFINNNNYNKFRFVLSSASFKEAGCSTTQELSLIFSKLVETLKYLNDKNYNVNSFLTNLVIHIKTGNDFFIELSKYRAFRVLWYNFIKAYELDCNTFPLLYSSSLKANKSFLDYHTNILRNTIEGFSAVLGGVNILELTYFDDFYKDNISDFTQRITRNIQILLQEEFNLSDIIDPSGGSYFIESITDELVNKSWTFFTEIQNNGGFIPSIKSNFIQNEIIKIRNQKVNNFSIRQEVLIGVNKYPKLNDEIIDIPSSKQINKDDFITLSPVRFAEPFEKLRLKSLNYQKKLGRKPKVFIATYGKLSQYKARLDFVNDFFNVGGISTEVSNNSDNVETLIDEFMNSGTNVIIYCSSDEFYEEMITKMNHHLNKTTPQIKQIITGNPKEKVDFYKKIGIDEFIHIKSNIVEVVNKVYNWLKR